MNGIKILTIFAAIVIGVICLNLIADLHNAKEELEGLKDQVAQLQAQLAISEARNASLSDNLLALQQENAGMAQKINKLEAETLRLSGLVASLHQDNNRLRLIYNHAGEQASTNQLPVLLNRLLGVLAADSTTPIRSQAFPAAFVILSTLVSIPAIGYRIGRKR